MLVWCLCSSNVRNLLQAKAKPEPFHICVLFPKVLYLPDLDFPATMQVERVGWYWSIHRNCRFYVLYRTFFPASSITQEWRNRKFLKYIDLVLINFPQTNWYKRPNLELYKTVINQFTVPTQCCTQIIHTTYQISALRVIRHVAYQFGPVF